MGVKAVRYLLFAQVILWISLLISFVLLPSVVFSNHGISHFGVHARTVLPYGLGFLLCGYLTILAAHAIEHKGRITTMLARALLFLSLFLLAILLTPFSVSTLFDWSHMIAGALLFLFELMLGTWLVRLETDWINGLVFAVQCLGSVVAASSFMGMTELMFTGQVVAEVAFGILLVRATSQILRDPKLAEETSHF